MRFRLTYRGSLRSGATSDIAEKQRLRFVFHDQLGDHPRHPVFLIFMAGAIIVTVVAGAVEGFLRKKYFDQNYRAFVPKYRDASRLNRTVFFSYLFRAYEKWREGHPDAPDNL